MKQKPKKQAKKQSVRTPKKTPNSRSLGNLQPPWEKGHSGNPGGRPKKLITDAYEFLAQQKVPGDPKGRTYAEILAEAQFREAIKGKTQSAKEITDRLEGKALQRLEVTGDEGGPVNISLNVKFTDPEEAKPDEVNTP